MSEPIWRSCYTCRDYSTHRREALVEPLADKAIRERRDIVEVVDEFMNAAHERHLDGTPLRPGGPTRITNPAIGRLVAMLSPALFAATPTSTVGGLDLAGVVAAHRPRTEATGFVHGCTCGWDVAHLTGTWTAHLADALATEVTRWLGDEGTRERVTAMTEGLDRAGTSTWRQHDRDVYSLAVEECTAALAALTDTQGGSR